MTESSVVALDTEIESFIEDALAHASAELSKVREFSCTGFFLAGEPFLFFESSPSLVQGVTKCFKGHSAPTDHSAYARIFADYSGLHVKRSQKIQDRIGTKAIAFDPDLIARGYRAVFDAGRNSWDIYDTNSRLGARLQNGVESAPPWETTSPLKNFSKWIVESTGKVMLHAGTIFNLSLIHI